MKGITTRIGVLLTLLSVVLVSLGYILPTFAIPLYTVEVVAPANNTTYSPGTTYWFNMTWANETADENMTMCNVTIGRPDGSLTDYSQSTTPAVGLNSTVPPALCYFNLSQYRFGPAGTYNYTFSAQNDTGDWNTSFPTTVYVVAQNTSTADFMNLTINDTEESKSYTYGAVSNATGWNSISELTFTLYRNDTTIGATNPVSDADQLGAGFYVYVYNTSDNSNYSAASKSFNLTITQADVPLALYINGIEGNKTLNESSASPLVPVNITVVGTFVGTTPDTNISLFIDSNPNATNSTPLLVYTDVLSGLGSYNITAVWPGDVNYSANTTTYYLTIADNTSPVVSLGSPGNYTGGGQGAGTSNTSQVSLTYIPYDLRLSTCSLWGTFTGSWALNQTNTTPANLTENSFSLTLADGTYLWNVRCNDTSGNAAFNSTNYTLRVDTASPNVVAVWTNDTDDFYSNCSGNNNITLVVNASETGLNVTANFSAIETGTQAGEIVQATDLANGLYRAVYTINTTDSSFEGRPVYVTTSDSFYTVVNTTNATETPILYNMTIPSDPQLVSGSTNFCNVTNFAAIPSLTFNTTRGKIVFIDLINMSTSENAAKIAQLATHLNVTDKVIGINSTYFDYLNKSAILYMYNVTQNLTQNLTYIPEGATEPQYCTGSLCISPSWNNTTNIMIFNISMFSKYIADDAAPVISGLGPSGTTSSTTVTLTAATNERAFCRYSSSDVAYDSMTAFSSTNSTAHSSTLTAQSIGSHTYYVRCRDIVNNTNNASSTISLTILAITVPSGAGPSGEVTTTKDITSIAAGETAVIPISITGLPITEVDVTAASSISNVKITITSLNTQPSSVSIAAPGMVYNYLSIESTAPASAVAEFRITFRVEKSWIEANDIDVSAITLNHYKNGAWTSLDTSQTSEDGVYIYFTATTPSLSYFAITAQALGAATEEGCPICVPTAWSACAGGIQTRMNYDCSAETNYECEPRTEERTCGSGASDLVTWGLIIAIAIIAIGFTIYAFSRRRNAYNYRPQRRHR